MFGILGWILFGLIVGVVAKLVMPGTDPGGFIVTILLGVAGAVLGGWLGQVMGMYRTRRLSRLRDVGHRRGGTALRVPTRHQTGVAPDGVRARFARAWRWLDDRSVGTAQ